jgi:hypothetical protein
VTVVPPGSVPVKSAESRSVVQEPVAVSLLRPITSSVNVPVKVNGTVGPAVGVSVVENTPFNAKVWPWGDNVSEIVDPTLNVPGVTQTPAKSKQPAPGPELA